MRKSVRFYFNLYGLYIGTVLFLLMLLAGCQQSEQKRTLDVLKVAILPDQSESINRQKYQPLVDYLASYTGMNAVLMVPKSYAEMLQWFNTREVDLVLLGGFTFVKASLANNAKPLVFRNVDGAARSVVLVRSGSAVNSLNDLKATTLAFGSMLSTSGHFMPRYFLNKQNINPEMFFKSIQYSGAHDLTAEWVRDGKVVAGVLNSGIAKEMFNDGRLNTQDVKIIWESPAFADNVWAVQSDIEQQQIILIRNAFLCLNSGSKNEILLESLGASYFVPAGEDDFKNLKQIMQQTDYQESAQ